MLSVEVRPPHEQELLDVDRLAKEFFDYYFDGEQEFATATKTIQDSYDAGMLFVAVDEDGSVVGFIGGGIGPLIGSPEITLAYEQAWWVMPEARRSGAGLMLISAFEEEARLQGCDYISMIALDKNDQIASIYESRGYEPKEQTFVKRF